MGEYERSAYSLPTKAQACWGVHADPRIGLEIVKSIRTDPLFVLFVTFLLTICRYELVKQSSSRYKIVERDRNLLRIRHSAATLCYGFAWISMIALIAMVAIAELLLGEAAASGDGLDADTAARLNIARRVPR